MLYQLTFRFKCFALQAHWKNGFTAANTTLTSTFGSGFQSLGTLFGSRAISSLAQALLKVKRFSNKLAVLALLSTGGPGSLALGGALV